jgi:hypothetical protein
LEDKLRCGDAGDERGGMPQKKEDAAEKKKRKRKKSKAGDNS